MIHLSIDTHTTHNVSLKYKSMSPTVPAFCLTPKPQGLVLFET